MKIEDLLLEVRILDGINTVRNSKEEPIKDSDTIRVYHGFNSEELLKWIIVNGISGDARIFRQYSYENNNNPYGVFVTTNYKTARRFGNFVIEFHTRVSDLEAPVWPSGSYTVQGGEEKYWSSEGERKSALMDLRSEELKSEYEIIAKSDRPELAKSLLMSHENQALFVGNLNPNSIRAIWIDDVRKTRKEVLSSLGKVGKEDKVGKPRENITLNDLILHYRPEAKSDEGEYNFVLEVLAENPDYIYRKVWNNKQYLSIVDELEKLGFDVSRHRKKGHEVSYGFS